jgi:hypothetical protein
LEGELEAQVIVGNMGVLQVKTGHLRRAEGLLQSAYQRERALAGNSAAVAAVMGWFGELLTLTGRTAQGLQVAQEAADMAVRYAGAASPVALQNLLFLADAQVIAGQLQAARATLVNDRDVAVKQYGAKHLWTLRAQMFLADFDFRHGSAPAARAELVATIEQLRRLGPRAEPSLAQALQSLGEIDLSTGQAPAAADSFRAAIAILGRFAPSGWNMAAARERLGETLGVLRQPDAMHELQQALPVLSAELGEEHAETLRAKLALRALDKATPVP